MQTTEAPSAVSQIDQGPLQPKNSQSIVGLAFLLGLATGSMIPVAIKFFNPPSKQLVAKVADETGDSKLEAIASAPKPAEEDVTSETKSEAKSVQKQKIAAPAVVKKSNPTKKVPPKASASGPNPSKVTASSTNLPKAPASSPKKASQKAPLTELPTSLAMVNPAPAAAAPALISPTATPAAPARGSPSSPAGTSEALGGSSQAVTKTISMNSYSKDNLTKCAKFCMLRGKDANGAAVSAIINGREFADVLNQHQGSVQLVGKQQTIKGRSVFMVQSINLTFE